MARHEANQSEFARAPHCYLQEGPARNRLRHHVASFRASAKSAKVPKHWGGIVLTVVIATYVIELEQVSLLLFTVGLADFLEGIPQDMIRT